MKQIDFMTRYFIFFIIVVGIIAIGIFGFGSWASALTIERFSDDVADDVLISPVRWEEAVEPGDVFTRAFQVGNRTDSPMIFELRSEDFVGSSDVNDPIRFLGEQYADTTAKDWIVPEVREFRLEPGERAVVSVVIGVPRAATPGGHFAALLATGRPIVGQGQESALQVRTQLGVLLLADVVSGATDDTPSAPHEAVGQIRSLRADGGTVHIDNTIPFRFALNNTGASHLNATGTLTLSNISGTIIDVLAFDDFIVLPGVIREKELIWSRDLLFGRYRALLNVSFADARGQAAHTSQAATIVWVIPTSVLIAIAIGIGLVWFMWYLRQWRKKYPS